MEPYLVLKSGGITFKTKLAVKASGLFTVVVRIESLLEISPFHSLKTAPAPAFADNLIVVPEGY